MNIRHYALMACAALLAASPAMAQLSFGGAPIGTKAEKSGMPAAPVMEFPAVDASALMAEDEAQLASGIKGPWRFGFNHVADLSTENNGLWTVLADGTRIWRMGLYCPGAFSINFEFGEYVVPQGARVFVFNEAHDFIGAFTAASNPGHTELGVMQLAGERVTVEYQEPANVAGQGHLRITQVTHAYRDILRMAKGLGDSGSCNNNVICPEGDPWRDQIASVAMITVGGSGICTGQLINNCASDGTPYFLTANHCTTGSNVGTWGFRFNWESPTCTPTTNGPTNQNVSGATLLVNNGASDVALLLLNTTPPASYNVYYSGWDASGDTPANQTCIHHPSGDIKKISFDYQSAAQASFGSASCWQIFNWNDGTTEPGSSGSGLWDQDKRLIGQLFGGSANCGNNVNDFFGRFDVSYPLLDDWLNPGTCGLVVDGYDPNFNPVALDAAIESIDDVQDQYCNVSNFYPLVTIKNSGTTTLTSLTLEWNLDGGTNTSVNWTGSLVTGATATIGFGAIPVGNGTHTFNVACSNPNGGIDLNTSNDDEQENFSVASPGQVISINITLDDWGTETTWELTTDGGTLIATGGPYADEASGTVESSDLCLPNGCYTFTIDDDYGDGICCSAGNGDYEIVDGYGGVLVDGDGDFGDQAVNDFCLTNTGIDDASGSNGVSVHPNPSTGMVTVSLSSDAPAQLILRDALGRDVLHRTVANTLNVQLDLSDLPAGTYGLETILNGQRSMRRIALQH